MKIILKKIYALSFFFFFIGAGMNFIDIKYAKSDQFKNQIEAESSEDGEMKELEEKFLIHNFSFMNNSSGINIVFYQFPYVVINNIYASHISLILSPPPEFFVV